MAKRQCHPTGYGFFAVVTARSAAGGNAGHGACGSTWYQYAVLVKINLVAGLL